MPVENEIFRSGALIPKQVKCTLVASMRSEREPQSSELTSHFYSDIKRRWLQEAGFEPTTFRL